jgi:glycosyltransferase involved in cell wall biosynthesis
MRAAERILRGQGCKRIVLYLWRPEFAPAIDALSPDLVCYHIDDEYTFSKDDIPLQPAESALITRSNRVFVSSKELLAKKGRLNPAAILVPNGVDFRAYSTSCPEPADLASIPRPRVGYVGVIKQHLDLQLMLDVARLRPQWSVVFVGPEGPLGDQVNAMDELRRQPNVHFIERRPQDELPAYVQHLDVCSLCYVLNGYTKYIYPLKLHEYLASGQPVVSTHLPALAEFSGTIAFAGGASEWCAAIDHLLTAEERSNSRVEQRRQVARNYDWDRLVARIAASIHSGLTTRASSGV